MVTGNEFFNELHEIALSIAMILKFLVYQKATINLIMNTKLQKRNAIESDREDNFEEECIKN